MTPRIDVVIITSANAMEFTRYFAPGMELDFDGVGTAENHIQALVDLGHTVLYRSRASTYTPRGMADTLLELDNYPGFRDTGCFWIDCIHDSGLKILIQVVKSKTLHLEWGPRLLITNGSHDRQTISYIDEKLRDRNAVWMSLQNIGLTVWDRNRYARSELEQAR